MTLTLLVVAWLLTYLVHSTILLGGAWLLSAARVVRSPVARDAALEGLSGRRDPHGHGLFAFPVPAVRGARAAAERDGIRAGPERSRCRAVGAGRDSGASVGFAGNAPLVRHAGDSAC